MAADVKAVGRDGGRAWRWLEGRGVMAADVEAVDVEAVDMEAAGRLGASRRLGAESRTVRGIRDSWELGRWADRPGRGAGG
ncbi:hypothetical protein [Actinomadura sp. 3N407]|uniref:hypothetical protein n=1 Tax=Actinomadura sp. 3N407 TaxID=3457423 RepID=UPI003FCC8012